MSAEWKQYRPKLALYNVLDKGGGISVDHALKRAESAVENYRGQASDQLTKTLSELDAIAKARTEEGAARVYELSTYMLDIAGMFQPPLCRAAHSLCELAHRMKAADRWDWASVDVHISAMRLLIGKREDNDPGVRSVLNGLGGVVAKFPDPGAHDPKTAPPAEGLSKASFVKA